MAEVVEVILHRLFGKPKVIRLDPNTYASHKAGERRRFPVGPSVFSVEPSAHDAVTVTVDRTRTGVEGFDVDNPAKQWKVTPILRAATNSGFDPFKILTEKDNSLELIPARLTLIFIAESFLRRKPVVTRASIRKLSSS